MSNPKAARSELERKLTSLGQLVTERESAQIIQLPLWPEPKRGTPNSFLRSALFSAIQGKNRQYLDEATLASQDGITVKFTGKQLNQEDLTLWETLVHLARQHPLGNACMFTAYGLLKALGLPTGGAQHRVLHKALLRLTACAVQITHDGKTYFGPLIESGAKDEITSHYVIKLNRDIIRLYGESQWTAIDWQQRIQLRSKPLAQALHAYYSSHRSPFPVRLAFLQKITGSKDKRLAGFARNCRAALNQLVRIGFLHSYAVQDGFVTVSRRAALPRA